MKVSFFRAFYSGYNVIALDKKTGMHDAGKISNIYGLYPDTSQFRMKSGRNFNESRSCGYIGSDLFGYLMTNKKR